MDAVCRASERQSRNAEWLVEAGQLRRTRDSPAGMKTLDTQGRS